MINNEIRRLLACLVDASKENGTTLSELEAELQRLFDTKKDENDTNSLAVATKTFKDMATLFVTREALYKPCLPRQRSISILCVFYEDIALYRVQLNKIPEFHRHIYHFDICAYFIYIDTVSYIRAITLQSSQLAKSLFLFAKN